MRKLLMLRIALTVAAGVVAVSILAAAGSGATGASRWTHTGTTITTALSSSSTVVGGAGVHDTATLSGLAGSSFSGDMVTYTVYPSLSDCQSATNGSSEGSVAVSGNGPVGGSNTFAPTNPGIYYWQASFNGADKTNPAASSSCRSEPLWVNGPRPASLTTRLSATTTTVSGTSVTDTATLSGLSGSTFTGDTVSYTVYPSLSDCLQATDGTSEGTVPVSGNGAVATSNSFVATSPGTYYWQASFNGADKTNPAVSSSCSSEPLRVGSQATSATPSSGRHHPLCVRIQRGRHHRLLWICIRRGQH